MRIPLYRLARCLVGAAAVGLLGLAPLQVVSPDATPPASAASYDACGVVLRKASGGVWTCSFVDKFNNRRLNDKNWAVGQTAVSGFRSGPTCFTASPSNVLVRRGTLLLTTRAEKRPFVCTSPYGSFESRYTGGTVTSWGRFAQTYGRFEVRAKYPRTVTPGLHGAFWLYPQKLRYGAWPASGEIDVAEFWSSQPQLQLPSLHYPGRTFWDDSGWDCVVADSSVYHTYAVEWSATRMQFFIDGSLCFDRSWIPAAPLAAPEPFNHPFNLVLTMGVGSEPASNRVTSATTLPATYTVDYAKAWR